MSAAAAPWPAGRTG